MSRSVDDAAVGGIVLAAGAGRRFGRPKALVAFAGEPLVERAARVLAGGGCGPVLAVIGADAEAVAARTSVDTVVNADWPSGMASSLRTGLAALEGRCAAVVVALADQPRVGSRAVSRLIDAWRAGAVAAVATYGGQPRNPVLLDASVWAEVTEAASGDAGARPWLRANAARVTRVACDDTGDPTDIDTPDDLAALEEEPTWS